MSNKLKGVWVVGGLWECKELSLLEKHFLQKIKDLDNESGCFANNHFFSDFFSISKGRCTQVINKLVEKKMIAKTVEKKGVLVTRRVLRILNKGVKLFKQGGVKDSKLGVYFSKQEVFKKLKDSNTLKLNNTIKEYKEREKEALTKIQILETQLKTLQAENEKLKTKEEPKEKSTPKKEKVKHVFPDPKAKKSYTVPKTESETKKPYEMFLNNYPFKDWSEKLKQNFIQYCEVKHENSKGKYSPTQIKMRIVEIVEAMETHEIQDIEKIVQCGANGSWADFDFNERIKNRKEKLAQPANGLTDSPFIGQVSLKHKNVWNK